MKLKFYSGIDRARKQHPAQLPERTATARFLLDEGE